MATRSAIVAKIGNQYKGIYCHAMSFSTLKKHYDKPEQKAHGFSRGMNANTVMIL